MSNFLVFIFIFCYYCTFDLLFHMFPICRASTAQLLRLGKGLNFERVGSNCATLFYLLLLLLVFFLLNPKLIYLFTSEHRLGRSGKASSNNSLRLPRSQRKKQTSVKFKMSVVNLLERLHLSRNMNTCSLIAFSFFFFSRGRLLFHCCDRHRCAH